MSDTLKHSFKTSLPVMAGYIVLDIGFGIMMADRGFARYRLCCRASRHTRGGGSRLRCAAAQAKAQHAFKRYRRDRRAYDSDTRYVKELCFRFKKAELF